MTHNSSPKIAYFGYGSLVNLATLRTPYISAHRARLNGWRRTWLARPKVSNSFAPVDGLAFLSVEPAEDATIDGLLVFDHRSSLPSLDEREALYDRVPIKHDDLAALDPSPISTVTELYLYVAQQPPAQSDASILRSYLDAVMQGYLEQFGEDGLERFIQTTSNFGCPIKEDRTQPLYPRSVQLSSEETALFDRLLPSKHL